MSKMKDYKQFVCIPTRRNEQVKPKIDLFKGWQLQTHTVTEQFKRQHDGIGIVTGEPSWATGTA